MDVILVPFIDNGVFDFVIKLHLPISHVHFQQPFVGLGIWITAEGGEFDGSRERTAIDFVERTVCLQIFIHLGCFLGE